MKIRLIIAIVKSSLLQDYQEKINWNVSLRGPKITNLTHSQSCTFRPSLGYRNSMMRPLKNSQNLSHWYNFIHYRIFHASSSRTLTCKLAILLWPFLRCHELMIRFDVTLRVLGLYKTVRWHSWATSPGPSQRINWWHFLRTTWQRNTMKIFLESGTFRKKVIPRWMQPSTHCIHHPKLSCSHYIARIMPITTAHHTSNYNSSGLSKCHNLMPKDGGKDNALE